MRTSILFFAVVTVFEIPVVAGQQVPTNDNFIVQSGANKSADYKRKTGRMKRQVLTGHEYSKETNGAIAFAIMMFICHDCKDDGDAPYNGKPKYVQKILSFVIYHTNLTLSLFAKYPEDTNLECTTMVMFEKLNVFGYTEPSTEGSAESSPSTNVDTCKSVFNVKTQDEQQLEEDLTNVAEELRDYIERLKNGF